MKVTIDYDEETGLGFVTSDGPLKDRPIKVTVKGDEAQFELF